MHNKPSRELWNFILTTHEKKITEINLTMIEILVPYRFPMESRSEVGGSTLLLEETYRHLLTRVLHWVSIPMPMPMPTYAHGFWVGMGAILLFMGGHRFCASLHPVPNRSRTFRMQGMH
jgi:hypothetical protein